jgi:transposase
MVDASLDASHQAGTYRRIELITGESQRRRWTAEEKAQILADSFEPGAKVSDVARRHGVNRGLLWTWRREVRKRAADSGQTFVPVRIAGGSEGIPGAASTERRGDTERATAAQPEGRGTDPATGLIDIEIGGARVRVSGTVDPAVLRQVLSYLGRR